MSMLVRCPEWFARATESDEDFWDRVARNLGQLTADDWLEEPDRDVAIGQRPCGVCGSSGACGYDSEGRALIHADDGGDDT